MRSVGTVVRGIRTPIIKANDDLANIVVDSLLKAKENEKFEFRDKDVVARSNAKGKFHSILNKGKKVVYDKTISVLENEKVFKYALPSKCLWLLTS